MRYSDWFDEKVKDFTHAQIAAVIEWGKNKTKRFSELPKTSQMLFTKPADRHPPILFLIDVRELPNAIYTELGYLAEAGDLCKTGNGDFQDLP